MFFLRFLGVTRHNTLLTIFPLQKNIEKKGFLALEGLYRAYPIPPIYLPMRSDMLVNRDKLQKASRSRLLLPIYRQICIIFDGCFYDCYFRYPSTYLFLEPWLPFVLDWLFNTSLNDINSHILKKKKKSAERLDEKL